MLIVLGLAALAFVLPAALAIALSLTGCVRLAPVEPVPEPAPAPLEPAPVIAPTAPPCVRACAHRAALGCAPTYSACVPTCTAYESEARAERQPALGWGPECMASAATCDAADACRGSGQP